jgi:hypothetical protein
MVIAIRAALEKFHRGDKESAFFELLEMPGDVLPKLIEVFRGERKPASRALLAKVAWERRDRSVIPFLGEVLMDSEEEVWQEALDGLVAFASNEALEILLQARNREFNKESDGKRFRLWLDEAIGQVQDVINR